MLLSISKSVPEKYYLFNLLIQGINNEELNNDKNKVKYRELRLMLGNRIKEAKREEGGELEKDL